MIQKKLDTGWTLEEAKASLEVYTKAQLSSKLMKYVVPFLLEEKNWLLSRRGRIAAVYKSAEALLLNKYPNKEGMLTICAVPFLTPELFRRFMTYLPSDSVRILEDMVLEGAMYKDDIEAQYGIKASEKSKKADWRGTYPDVPVKSLDFFFALEPRGYFYHESDLAYTFPYPVRELIAGLLFDKPGAVTDFEPDAQDSQKQLFLGEQDILSEIPGLLIRMQQKPPRLSKKGKPSIATVRSIGKKLNIREFYPKTETEELRHLRAIAVVGLLAQAPNLSAGNTADIIKSLFNNEYVKQFCLPVHLMGYIQGINKLGLEYFYNNSEVYKHLIRGLKPGLWFRCEELEYSLKKQLFNAYPVHDYGTSELYVMVPSSYSNTKDYLRVAPYREARLLLWPAFRANFFVFAAWGLIDIIYTEPDISHYTKTADSPYDGIEAIRLTDLGAYVLGLSKSYTSKVKAPFTLELDTDSLSILLSDGDQERAALAIASFAKPMGDKRFYTDAGLFLSDCKGPADLDHKIGIFKSIFSTKLPPNWKAFFDEIKQKVNPLKEDTDFAVFRLDPENRSLLQLIARDPELKRLCLKAEGFLILIAHKDLNKFRKRLGKFGYLLE